MNHESDKAIGILDSGVGGLTVVREFFRHLPSEKIVYFGDTYRFPYGSRPHDEVRRFSLQIIEFLKTQEIKMIVVACNSSTAAGLHHYQQQLDIPVVGVIEPGARAAVETTRNGRIGVIGTTGTVASGAYEKSIHALDPSLKVFSMACPLLVLIVENDLIHTPEAHRVAHEYLHSLKQAGVDTLILGCTHYPLMADVLQDIMGNEVTLISSTEEIVRGAKELFAARNLLKPPGESTHRFFVSGDPDKFEETASKLLGSNLKSYRVML